MSDYLVVQFYDKEAQKLFDALTLQIKRLQADLDTQREAQWAMIAYARTDRLLGEARLSLDRIKNGSVEDAQAEAERGLNASMWPTHAPEPYNAIPHTERILEAYMRLASALQNSMEDGWDELQRQIAAGIVESIT